jgi:hypothetical protein
MMHKQTLTCSKYRKSPPPTKQQTAHIIRCALSHYKVLPITKEAKDIEPFLNEKWPPVFLSFYCFQHLTAVAAGLLEGQDSDYEGKNT